MSSVDQEQVMITREVIITKIKIKSYIYPSIHFLPLIQHFTNLESLSPVFDQDQTHACYNGFDHNNDVDKPFMVLVDLDVRDQE